MQICCPACNFVDNYGNNINLILGTFVNGIHSLCPKTVDSTNAYVVNVRPNLPFYHVSWLWERPIGVGFVIFPNKTETCETPIYYPSSPGSGAT